MTPFQFLFDLFKNLYDERFLKHRIMKKENFKFIKKIVIFPNYLEKELESKIADTICNIHSNY